MSQEFDCHYGEADEPTSIYMAGNEYGLGTWITAVISGMVLAISQRT